jgi:hypothetical protein
MFRPERDTTIVGWRKLHREELHIFYSSANIIRMINSRRMKWAGNVAHERRKKRPLGRCSFRCEQYI